MAFKQHLKSDDSSRFSIPAGFAEERRFKVTMPRVGGTRKAVTIHRTPKATFASSPSIKCRLFAIDVLAQSL
jgi:hypothetical protein